MQLTLAVAPGGEEVARALAGALDTVRNAGWPCQQASPASEAVLRRELGASTVLHLVADAAAVGSSYITLRLADSAGGVRGLNVQALATLLRQAAPGLRLLLLQPAAAGEAARAPHALAVQALAKAGVSALVSMAATTTAAAHAAFYRALAAGDRVDAAVAAANAAALGTVATVHAGGEQRLRAAAAPAPPTTTQPASPAAATTVTSPSPAAESVFAEALRSKREAGRFDVFLCHNSADKPAVKRLGEGLKARGLLPWLDEWELPPGQAWQELLERQIQRIGSAAVCIGPAGISPWHQQEMRGFISEFVDRRVPVIPVLLPGAPAKPELPLFLRQFTWVDFRRDDPDPFDQIVWGITGQRPGSG